MQTRTNIIISCAVGVAILSILALRGNDPRRPAAIAEELIPAEETHSIGQVVEQFKRQFAARDGRNADSRTAYPKYHGCARAEFTVVENLAPQLTVGIFQPGARYKAWVRFSTNADPHAGIEPEIRSMEIKLLGVPGEKLYRFGVDDNEAHDLLLVSQASFPFPDVETYAQAFAAFAADKTVQYYFNPFDPHIKSFLNARNMPTHRTNLLGTRWWSAVPYRYGEYGAVKYSARPCGISSTSVPDDADDEYLHDQLKRHLRDGAGCFEFMLQFQTDANTMPIEDPSIAWDEVLTPFEPVALLTIAAQNIESDEQQNFCRDLSYNPWRALAEHRPLGGINRARREIYAALADSKRRRNDSATRNPTDR